MGNDWAEDHHDVELVDEQGRLLSRRRVPEGVAGLAVVHTLIGDHLGEDAEPSQVLIGIETDRGPWVQALVAANPHDARTLFAEAFQDNPGSAKVLTNCGFAYLGDAESWSVARNARVPTWTYLRRMR